MKMSKVLFVVFCVIVGCAMAIPDEIYEKMCSVRATGTADVSGIGEGLSARMTRVRNTVRYDVYTGQAILASLLMRYDKSRTYFFKAGATCEECSNTFYLSSFYQVSNSPEGYEVYRESSGGSYDLMYFKGDKLVKEELFFEYLGVNITMNYKNVDYNFELNVNDGTFVLQAYGCSSAADAPRHAKSLAECGHLELPDNFCAVSGTGTATICEGSTCLVPLHCDVEMHRVKSTVRYDFKQGQTPFYSLVVRPDLRDSYFYAPGAAQGCIDVSECPILGDYYFEDITDEGLEVFTKNNFKMFFDHYDKRKLVSELLSFYSINHRMEITVNYTSVDYKYMHKKADDLFSIDSEDCPEAKEPAPYATNSMQCDEPMIKAPVPSKCAYEAVFELPEGALSGYGDNSTVVVKGLMDGSKVLVLNFDIGNGIENYIVRFDIKNKAGEALVITNYYYLEYYGQAAYEGCYMRYMDVYGNKGIDMMMPFLGFEHRCEPVDCRCPDKTSGCKKYCSCADDSFEDDCVIFDKNGYLVGVPFDDEMIEVRYSDAVPSIGDFRGTFCNRTRGKIPSTECQLSPDSVSSASFSLPSILLVAVAVVLVLF